MIELTDIVGPSVPHGLTIEFKGWVREELSSRATIGRVHVALACSTIGGHNGTEVSLGVAPSVEGVRGVVAGIARPSPVMLASLQYSKKLRRRSYLLAQMQVDKQSLGYK